MATTVSIDKTARIAGEMAEAQRDSYEALTQNFAAAQRRGMELAEGTLDFVKLQEENARVTQEWFADGMKLLQLQQRNAEYLQGWSSDALKALREQAEHNTRTAEAFAQGVSRQQEGLRTLAGQWTGAYRNFFSPVAYAQEGMKSFQRVTRQGLEVTEQIARQGLEATEEATRQGLRVAEEATERTEDVLRRTEEATRETELRAVVFGALKTTDYEGLTVEEISKRVEGLSTEQLRKVQEFEKQNKRRETLIEQLDRKIKSSNNS